MTIGSSVESLSREIQMTQQTSQTLPVLRVVTTSRCNLRCHYCPPDNEDFPSSLIGKGGPRNIDWNNLRTFLRIAIELGVKRISLTGGEPLLSEEPVHLLVEFANAVPHVEWVLQTNGVHLRKHLVDLAKLSRLTLKISLDVFDRQAFQRMCGQDDFDEVVLAIRAARFAGLRVGINSVLTTDSLPYAPSLVAFARETGCYLKFLDLNWYVDIGARDNSQPISTHYWKSQYVSPARQLLPVLESEGVRGFDERLPHNFGIPVLDSLNEGSFFVRVKDSMRGTTYSPICMECPHFASRACQEGVYELALTPDFRLKICRHRPDIEYDVNPARHSPSRIRDTLASVFSSIYAAAAHHEVGKENLARFYSE